MIKRTNPNWDKKLEDALQSEMTFVVENAMLRVEGRAKEIVYLGRPDHLIRRTGTLQRSITTEVDVSKNCIIANTGTNLNYAPTHEFGDTFEQDGKVIHIPARPFLMPAWMDKKDEVAKLVKSGYARIINSVRSR